MRIMLSASQVLRALRYLDANECQKYIYINDVETSGGEKLTIEVWRHLEPKSEEEIARTKLRNLLAGHLNGMFDDVAEFDFKYRGVGSVTGKHLFELKHVTGNGSSVLITVSV